jgi:hypothetical protein
MVPSTTNRRSKAHGGSKVAQLSWNIFARTLKTPRKQRLASIYLLRPLFHEPNSMYSATAVGYLGVLTDRDKTLPTELRIYWSHLSAQLTASGITAEIARLADFRRAVLSLSTPPTALQPER